MDNELQLPQDAQQLHDALANLIQDAGVLSRELTVGWQLLKKGEKPEPDAFSFLPRYSPPSVAEVVLGPQWPRIFRGLRKSVAEFLRQWFAVESALYGMPAATLAKLDAMDSPGWKDRLRRTLDKLLEWPLFKEACKSDSLGVEILVVALELCGPPDWKGEIQHLTKSKNDLYALRGPTPAGEDKLDSIIESQERIPAETSDGASSSQPETSSAPFPTPTKLKRSTERGEGQAKLISALTKHHKYADGGCLNLEPIGNNKLSRLANVSESTASTFFNKQFGGHTKYRAVSADATQLVAVLKLLNQEFSPHHLFGAKPTNEESRDDEE